jgi:protocatechuate 3,4-dioxygenase alpha subunit
MNNERLQQTPSQTVGPFFAYSLTAEQYGYDYNSIINGSLINEETNGDRIYVTGNIFDGSGNTVPDAIIELYHADDKGQNRVHLIAAKNDGFTGIGRQGTGTALKHTYMFSTLKPGKMSAEQAPHINVILFMRGSLHKLCTRIYFSDEVNDDDPLFQSIDPAHRQTLVAQRKEVNGMIHYHFDVYMQGEKETVFFEV